MPNPQTKPNSNYPAVGQGPDVAGSYDPTGTYDFGPRVGKVTNLKVNGRPATREEALQVIKQASGMGEGAIAQTQQKREGFKDFQRSQETDTFLRDTMRDILPMAALSPLSKMGMFKGVGAAAGLGAAGGQTGEIIDQLTGSNPPSGNFSDWLSRRGEDAMWGGATELGGRGLGAATRIAAKPLKGALGGSMGSAPRTLRENVAQQYRIHFTPSQVMDEFSTATGEPKGLLMRGEESRAFHNPYSRSIAQSGARQRGMEARSTVAGLVNQLGPEIPSNISGKRIANVIQSVGKPTWQRQVDKLASIVHSKAMKTEIDVSSLKQAAADELGEIETQQIQTGNVDETGKPFLPSSAKVRMLTEIANFPDSMPFTALMKKRSDWMGVSPQITELISGEAKGTAKHYTTLATELLDEAARGGAKTAPKGAVTAGTGEDAIEEALRGGPGTDPGAAAAKERQTTFLKEKRENLAGQQKEVPQKANDIRKQMERIDAQGGTKPMPPAPSPSTPRAASFEEDWNRFRNFTRKGADVFESQVITDAVNKNPEQVVKLLKGDDITDLLRIRRAIKGYADMFGSPADQVKSTAAWRKFQVSYLREKVVAPLEGNMINLQDSLDKMNPAFKKAIFDDSQSQQTLLRLTQVGKALKDADKNLGVLMGHQDPLQNLDTTKGWMRSLRPYIVSKIAWNPTATRFFLRGLAGLAENPPSDSAVKDFVTKTLIGKGSRTALRAGGALTNRRLGAAMADILRAYDVANVYEEAKRQEKEADDFIKNVNQPPPTPEQSSGVPPTP